MASLESIAPKLFPILQYCDRTIRELIPFIGQDEGLGRGKYNKEAREAVSALCRELAHLGAGDLAGTIRIGRISTAREAVAILEEWRGKIPSHDGDPKNFLGMALVVPYEGERAIALEMAKVANQGEIEVNDMEYQRIIKGSYAY